MDIDVLWKTGQQQRKNRYDNEKNETNRIKYYIWSQMKKLYNFFSDYTLEKLGDYKK